MVNEKAGTEVRVWWEAGAWVAKALEDFGPAVDAVHVGGFEVDGLTGVLRGDGGASVRAKLFIHRRCGRLAETLPAMQHDPNRPEDVLKVDADEDGLGGDDAADALRYLVATKPRVIVERRLTGL